MSTSPRPPRTPTRSRAAAAQLEDVAVGAYNGQAANVTAGAFLAAARIVSVEARHAAWIRSIRDGDPAPDAVDVPYDEKRVRRELRGTGGAQHEARRDGSTSTERSRRRTTA